MTTGTSYSAPTLTKYQTDTLRRAQKILANQIRESSVLSSPEKVRELLRTHLATRECEVFTVLFLDNRHRLIAIDDMFTGTIDSSAVYPREIVKAALNYNAAALMFAHNHPSQIANPSDTDIRLTHKLVEAASLVDIRVLDHFIVGNPDITSLAERGLLTP